MLKWSKYPILYVFCSPTDLHYIPSLHQFIYEIEDGYTPDGSRIRYGFDETIFPDFSWRGYAILNYVQVRKTKLFELKKKSQDLLLAFCLCKLSMK